MKIEILSFEGCPNHDAADRRIREVLSAMGIQSEVGADIAPDSNGGPFSMRCHVYPTSSGFEGAPDKDAIRTAIERIAA